MSIMNMSSEEISKATSPIGNARLKAAHTRTITGMQNVVEAYLTDEVKCHPKDKLECQICGSIYTRSGSAKHKKSKLHKKCEDINNKLIKAILKN